MVIDGDGAWINREEYSPYGETTFGGFARKRYRFTGKERDDESGLNYHGARYYAPWLATMGELRSGGHGGWAEPLCIRAQQPNSAQRSKRPSGAAGGGDRSHGCAGLDCRRNSCGLHGSEHDGSEHDGRINRFRWQQCRRPDGGAARGP